MTSKDLYFRYFFNREATWSYYEVGHGKSVCDGIGGTFKRMAEQAVKQEKVVINDAQDLFAWGKGRDGESLIKSEYYTQQDVENAEKKVKKMKPDAVIGIQSVHCIVGVSPGVIATRQTSCFCVNCLVLNFSCSGWTLKHINKEVKAQEQERSKTKAQRKEEVQGNKENQPGRATRTSKEKKTAKKLDVSTQEVNTFAGSWVAALYERKAFVGKVVRNDFQKGKVFINFMVFNAAKPQLLKWPEEKDELWMEYNDVLCNVNPPCQNGDLYILASQDIKVIKECLKKRR